MLRKLLRGRFTTEKQLPSYYNVDETLYIITVIYNPNDFKSRIKLYEEFKKYIDSFPNAKLLTVEIAFSDRPFLITSSDNEWNIQLRTDQEMWHKEAAINIGFNRLFELIPNAKYVGWFDADIKFTNPNWVKETIYALHKYCVVQPYAQAINLNPNYEYMWHVSSSLKHYTDRLGYHQSPPLPTSYLCGGHPGLAWAARADILQNLGGLADFCIAGSGDTHMLNALLGDVSIFYKKGMTPEFCQALRKWQDKTDKYVQRNLGYVHGICFHYWHGKSEQRGYEKRWDITCYHQFNPETDVVRDENGLYKWAGNKPELVYDLRKSMSQRNEDSIDL